MVTDKERKEVAARLRALPTDTCAAVKEWEKEGLFIGASSNDEADYSQIHNVLFGTFPAEHMHPEDYKELHERLADLIEPRTCAIESTEDIGYGEFNQSIGTGFHMSCGHTTWRACTDVPPAYCDQCGAKVIANA